MLSQITSLDLRYLIREFQQIVGSKIDQIYQPEKKSLILQLHTQKGKEFLHIKEKVIYLTDKKEGVGEPSSFCKMLRKYLTNSRIKRIEQYDFQRIVLIEFETYTQGKKDNYYLVCEFFDKGNIIFCDSDYRIISPIQVQIYKEREVKAKEKYNFLDTKNGIDNYENFKKIVLKKIEKTNPISKILAVDLSLGRLYATELCHLANLKIDSFQIEEDLLKKLYEIYEKLLNKKINARIYKKDEKVEIVPFELKHLDWEFQEQESFNKAIALYNEDITQKIKENNAIKKYDDEIKRIQKIIDMQTEQLKKLENEAETFQKIGNKIYENYGLIKSILEEIKKAREKYSWEYIKKKLMEQKIIKEIDEKNGKIVIDI